MFSKKYKLPLATPEYLLFIIFVYNTFCDNIIERNRYCEYKFMILILLSLFENFKEGFYFKNKSDIYFNTATVAYK